MVQSAIPDRVALRLLAQLGCELKELTSIGESLQGLVGRIATDAAVDHRFFMDAQGLDGLVQHMGELALFLERLAKESAETGLSDEALTRAAAPVRLSDLSDRLLSRGKTTPVLQRGEFELW